MTQASTVCSVILTRNEAVNIAACIESLHWTDSILVFDSESSDDTAKIAADLGVRVIKHPFENYSKQRDAALAAIRVNGFSLWMPTNVPVHRRAKKSAK